MKSKIKSFEQVDDEKQFQVELTKCLENQFKKIIVTLQILAKIVMVISLIYAIVYRDISAIYRFIRNVIIYAVSYVLLKINHD